MASTTMDMADLFDPDFLAALQSFSLQISRVPRGGRHADQKSMERGQGLEFVDFKPYVAGDDLRAIDWNIYQRLGKIFVKVFDERQDMPVYFLTDVSSSMFLEETPRIRAGLKVALALSSIALGQHDSVGIFPFSDDLKVKVKSTQGKRNLMRVARHLTELEEAQGTDLVGGLQQFSSYGLRRGLVVVISDFFDPAGLEAISDALKLCRHRLLLVQLVRSQDADPTLDPEFHGDVRLSDCESGAMAEVSINPVVLARYREIYQAFNQGLTDFADQYGAGFVQVNTDKDVLDQLSGLFATGSLSL